MGWATRHIGELLEGRTVQFRPTGNSMSGRIENRQLCTVVPLSPEEKSRLKKGDVVLCTVEGRQYLHLVVGIDKTKGRVMIANNQGWSNGWTGLDKVYGILTKVEP